jgi:nucleoside phosphorylase
MNTNPAEFGFVAALEREVAGLTSSGGSFRAPSGSDEIRNVGIANSSPGIYYSQGSALICAGTGVARAYAASKVLIEKCAPRVIISIGFAGACVANLRPGEVVVPSSVLEADTGRVFRCAFGCGQVVTLNRVGGIALKQDASARFGALAVDMEAAGVAAAALELGREFAAIKVISDTANQDMEFLGDFVKPEGFETGRFLAHIALRPELWPSVAALRVNSKLASAALTKAVNEYLGDCRGFSAKYSGHRAGLTKESCL